MLHTNLPALCGAEHFARNTLYREGVCNEEGIKEVLKKGGLEARLFIKPLPIAIGMFDRCTTVRITVNAPFFKFLLILC